MSGEGRGKTAGSRKRGRQGMRWTDPIKEAVDTSPQRPSRAVEDKTLDLKTKGLQESQLTHWLATHI